jgi:hypothetical protein
MGVKQTMGTSYPITGLKKVTIKKPRVKKIKVKKEKDLKKKETSEQPTSKTEYWSWEKLISKKDEFNKPSIDSLPNSNNFNTCQLCYRRIFEEPCIVNVICMHIYHIDCLIMQCRKYLTKSQYPED